MPAHDFARFTVAQTLATATGSAAEFFYALFALDVLLKAGLDGAAGVRFDTDLATDRKALQYDILLLPANTANAALKRAVKRHVVSARAGAAMQRLARVLPGAPA